MITLKGILEGNALYTEVYTQYGPLFFQVYELLYSILPIELNHNSNRMLTLVGWLVTAGLAARLMFRIHGSQPVSLISFIIVFFYLEVTVKEPGHPQQFCFILVLLALLATTGSRAVASAFLVGSLLAMLVLTKVNLGVFLALVILALTVSVTSGRNRIFFAIALLSAFFIFSFSVLASNFSFGNAWLLLTLFLSASAISLTNQSSKCLSRWVVGLFFCGALLTLGFSIGYCLLSGSQPADLIWAVVTQHAQLAAGQDVHYFWLGAVIAACGLWGGTIYKNHPKGRSHVYLSIAQFVYGLTILAVVTAGFASEQFKIHLGGDSVRGNAATIWWLAPGFAWLYSASNHTSKGISRLSLAMASAIFIIGAYPITGSQVSYSTALLILVAIGCLHDASKESLIFKGLKLDVMANSSLKLVATVLIVIGLHMSVLVFQLYRAGIGTNLPGADWIHLPAGQAKLFSDLVEKIKSSCSSFITIYGVNSLYFWTGQQPPTWWNLTIWPFYLTAEMQNDMISQLDKESEPCVIEDANFNYLKSPHVQTERGIFGRYVNESYVEYWRLGPYVAYHKR